MLSSSPSLGAAISEGKPLSTRTGSGHTSRGEGGSGLEGNDGVGSLDIQSSSHSEESLDVVADISP